MALRRYYYYDEDDDDFFILLVIDDCVAAIQVTYNWLRLFLASSTRQRHSHIK